MRSFFLVSAVLACVVLHAQPTIGAADLPQDGTVYLRANAVPPFNADDIEVDGENVTWNFSDLIGTGDQETEYFPMGSASFTTQLVFSSADHFTSFELPDLGADLPIPISGATVYREFGGNAYKTVGIGLTTDFIDLPVPFDDEEELLPLPLVYGAVMEETSAFTLDVEDLFYYATEQDMDIEVDAWGTLLLPGGEFECLRVKRTFSALDSINVAAGIGFTLPREGTVYEWYAPGEGMPVLSVQTFIDIPAVWQYKPGETDAVTEAAPTDWKLGPSPLPLGTPLRCPGLAGREILITDAMGRTLLRGQPTAAGETATLDTEGWTSGVVLVTDLTTGRSARVVIR